MSKDIEAWTSEMQISFALIRVAYTCTVAEAQEICDAIKALK